MAKDYASSKRPAPKATAASLSGFKWMLAGLCLGLLLAGFIYMKFSGNRALSSGMREQQPNATSDENAANETEDLRKGKRHPHHGGARVASNDTATNEKKPHFDFYTILPEMEVPIADNKPPATDAAASVSPETTKTPATTTVAAESSEATTPAETKPAKESAKSTTVDHDRPATTLAKRADDDIDNDSDTDDDASSSSTPNNNPDVTLPDDEDKEDKLDKSSTPTQASISRSNYMLQFATFKSFEDADRLKARLTLLGVEVDVQTVNIHGDTWYRVRKGPYSILAKAEKDRAWLHDNQIPVMVIKAEG
jgi:cell division protein FtsN